MIGEKPLPQLVPEAAGQARALWPAVVATHAESRSLQAEIRGYQAQTLVARRALVTPFLAAVCGLVYVAMVVRGSRPQPGTAPDARVGGELRPFGRF